MPAWDFRKRGLVLENLDHSELETAVNNVHAANVRQLRYEQKAPNNICTTSHVRLSSDRFFKIGVRSFITAVSEPGQHHLQVLRETNADAYLDAYLAKRDKNNLARYGDANERAAAVGRCTASDDVSLTESSDNSEVSECRQR